MAIRIVRLSYLARTRPDTPATAEFSEVEIRALNLLAPPKKPKQKPTLADIVLQLARLGGYVGRSSGGPPEALVLARGLIRLEPAATVLAALKKT